MAQLIEDPRIQSLLSLVSPVTLQYRVPIYQRDYAWLEDQLDDFTADVFASAGQDAEHFFGTIVLSDNAPGPAYGGDNDVKYVIDGQQRLTTSLLMLAVIRHHLIDLIEDGRDAGRNAAARLLPMTSLGIGTIEPKLHANRANQPFLSAILDGSAGDAQEVRALFGRLTDEEKQRSERLLSTYERLGQRLAQYVGSRLELRSSEEELEIAPVVKAAGLTVDAVNLLSELANGFLRRALFVEIQVRNWEDAFSVFEGLNNRGLELSEQDLVKNMVLARAHGGDQTSADRLMAMERRWDDLTRKIAQSKFSRFLRHFLLLHYSDVPLKRVVRLLNVHFAGQPAEKMLRDLERAAAAYERITRPSTVADSDQLRIALTNINTLEAERSYPIALAGMLADVSPADLTRVLVAVETLYFRRSAVMGRDNKTIEADFREIAADLFSAGPSGVEGTLEELRKLTPLDEDFVVAFERRHGIKDSIARYMLGKIENGLTRDQSRTIEFANVTLEHILPKDPSLWALDVSEAEGHAISHTRLGNLTVLTPRANASASNRPFVEKKQWYIRDGLRINEDVVEADEWRLQQIESRQRRLAQLACDTWPAR